MNMPIGRYAESRRAAFRSQEVFGATRHAVLPLSVKANDDLIADIRMAPMRSDGVRLFSFKTEEDLDTFLRLNPTAEEIKA